MWMCFGKDCDMETGPRRLVIERFSFRSELDACRETVCITPALLIALLSGPLWLSRMA